MKIVAAKCPNCGGILDVDSEKDAAVCSYCQMPFIVEKAIRNYNITNHNTTVNATINSISGQEVHIHNETSLQQMLEAMRQVELEKEARLKFLADWQIENETLIKYKGKDRKVVIPDGITCIGDNAFSGCKSLTSIVIPNSMKTVGKYAFCGCKSLISVMMGNGVTMIGDYAFADCEKLTSIVISDSVKIIGSSAFSRSALKNITIGSGVTEIGDRAFDRCCVVNLVIPNNVKIIDRCAFAGCWLLTSVSIGDGVVYIGDYAFSGCSSLNSVSIGMGVNYIGAGAFSECKSLSSIVIPDNVKTIGGYAFSLNRTYKYNEAQKKLTICCKVKAKPKDFDRYWNFKSERNEDYLIFTRWKTVWGYKKH